MDSFPGVVECESECGVDNFNNQHNKALQMSNMDMLTEAWFVPDMLRAPAAGCCFPLDALVD
jgi:hypothetical protein